MFTCFVFETIPGVQAFSSFNKSQTNITRHSPVGLPLSTWKGPSVPFWETGFGPDQKSMVCLLWEKVEKNTTATWEAARNDQNLKMQRHSETNVLFFDTNAQM